MDNRGVTFEAKGPNGWAIVGAGGLIGLALVIIALALWNLSVYAGVALIILALGQAAYLGQRGLALVVDARGRARALEAEAQTRRLATMRGKPLPAELGLRTRADIAALWGDDYGS